MERRETFPTIYTLSRVGKPQRWRVEVNETPVNEYALLVVQYGQVDGKLTQSVKKIKGKNIGKANETTPYEQALKEAKAKHLKQLTQGGYFDHIPTKQEMDDLLLPMLAQPFEKRKKHIEYPAIVQPKLNGVRCMVRRVSESRVIFRSRLGKSYDKVTKHLVPHLLQLLSVGETWDGELYVHGWTFQRIVRAVKKFREDDTPKLEFWVYDKVSDEDYADRYNYLWKKILEHGVPDLSPVKWTNSQIVIREAEIRQYHDFYVQHGFEGIIIRNRKGGYQTVYRSNNLQKYKEFIDHEFIIIDGRSSEGNQEGCVVFTVEGVAIDAKKKEHPAGVVRFEVVPRGTFEQRRKYLTDIDDLIGEEITVRYQELSEDGVPIFPVGVAIRDYE